MGYGTDQEGGGGDWKGGHMRIDSSEPEPPSASSADSAKGADDIELRDRDDKAHPVAGGGRRRPNAFNDNEDNDDEEGGPSSRDEANGVVAFQFYKVYKRRWFGLVQLTLLNIIVSWDWLTFSPVASNAAEYFNTNESAINWLSTGFLFAFCVMVPAVIYVLHLGPKLSIMVASVLILLGNWIRYGGVMASPPNFGVVVFGQILIGFGQPFVLSAPTRYSDLWFTNRGRVAATAIMSLANPLGAALGQLIIPFWVYSPSDIPNAVLYVAIIASVCCIPSFFIPAKPPTPAAPSGETDKLELMTSVRALTGSPESWLLLIPFIGYVGLFNSVSSLLNQIMVPYGFSDDDAGIAGAVLIVAGLVAAAITSPILDRTKAFLLAIRLAVPAIGLCYVIFIWMPATGSIAGPYVVLAILGAASFSLVPVVMEYLVELTHPVSPEVTSTLAWAGGQLLGALLIIISDALKATGAGARPPDNMDHALIFQAVVGLVVLPFPMCLGLFGRADKVLLKRVQNDDQTTVREPRAAAAATTASEDVGAVV